MHHIKTVCSTYSRCTQKSVPQEVYLSAEKNVPCFLMEEVFGCSAIIILLESTNYKQVYSLRQITNKFILFDRLFSFRQEHAVPVS